MTGLDRESRSSVDIPWPVCPPDEIISGERLQICADIAVTTEVRRAFHRSLPAMNLAVFPPDLEPNSELLRQFYGARVVFVYADMVEAFLARVLPRLPQPIVLVSHNSDTAVEQRHLAALEDGRIRHWFAQNAMALHPRLTALPIGVANAQWRHGDATLLAQIANESAAKAIGVYANFSVATNRSVRAPIYEALRTKAFVSFPRAPLTIRGVWARARALLRGKQFDVTRTPLPPEAYLRELARWRYCVSPRGNGVDCHRTWEALYLGCVPILTEAPPGLMDGLPHIFIQDFSRLSLPELEAAYAAMPVPTGLEKLRVSYWSTRIRAAALAGFAA